MRYSADAAMYCTAISGDLSTLVAGDERGGFHILRIENTEHRTPIEVAVPENLIVTESGLPDHFRSIGSHRDRLHCSVRM